MITSCKIFALLSEAFLEIVVLRANAKEWTTGQNMVPDVRQELASALLSWENILFLDRKRVQAANIPVPITRSAVGSELRNASLLEAGAVRAWRERLPHLSCGLLEAPERVLWSARVRPCRGPRAHRSWAMTSAPV